MPFQTSNFQSLVFIKHKSKILTLLFGLLCFSSSFAQFDIPDKPKLKDQTSVYDYTKLLSASQKSSLERKLIKYSDTTSTQIVVAIIASTNGENINYLGAQWGQKWGIGQEKEDNGILVLLAQNDRKISINTGYGVEHLLTDAMSRRIIERDIIPYFKQGNYYGGLDRGATAIFEVLNGEYKGTRSSNGPIDFRPIVFLFLIVVVLLVVFSSKNKGGGGHGGRRRRSNATDILETIILSNMGRSSSSSGWGSSGGGGWSSGGGSGGFGGGFGGGGFGGGGASGGW